MAAGRMSGGGGEKKRAEDETMASLVEVLRQVVGGYEELTNDRVTKATGIRELWGQGGEHHQCV